MVQGRRLQHAGPQLIEILFFAVIAGVILFRLYSVLGRRTGHESPPREQYRLSGTAAERASTASDTVVSLPERIAKRADAAGERPADPVARGLLDIKLADRKFETEHFMEGARAAYEMIVTAFAKGDRDSLRGLLSNEVYNAFDGVIRGREERHEKVEFTFVGFTSSHIVGAVCKGRSAEITVSFDAKYVSATSQKDGDVVEGDPSAVRDVTDIWTFGRDLGSRDPNWTLIATTGEES
jgi:predicted lipid-binding transport protein (Tim44 family)